MNLRERARRRLPRLAFDFIDGGSGDEVTLARNRSAFGDLALVPRVLAGVGAVSTAVELFGQQLSSPVLLAPAGGALITGDDGDMAAARAAEAAGTISVQAWSPELRDLNAGAAGRRWYQLYLGRQQSHLAASVRRAEDLGISALVLTADVPVAGNRERDQRNGLTFPLRLFTPKIAFDVSRRPAWLWRYFISGANQSSTFGRRVGAKVSEVESLAEAVRAQFNPEQTWDDLRWLRDLWSGPLLLKGVLSGADAELAVQAGCDGVIVSNHGGRQLDGTPAAIEMLPEVVQVVNGRAEVLLDGGVRRGADVIKALSLGAKACLIGRPWLFAVVVDGESGVTQLLARIDEEIARDLHLLGIADVAELGPGCLRRRAGTEWLSVD